jgi:predicted ATPase
MPWVIVLEDLHRADAASLELLGLMLDELAHMRILVVATLRPKSAGRSQRSERYLSEVVGHRNCERIVLERLTQEDVSHYVRAMMKDADGSIARVVFTQSEGNPFFMTELSRQLEEDGAGSRGPLAIPSSALDVVKQRLARLEPEARRVLSAAAVIGRTFELSVLASVSGREPADLMVTLDDAIASEVLIVAPDSSTAFAFGHELLRTVLYEALSLAEQRSWHLVVAHALETRLHAGHPIPPSELAFHCHAALPQGDLRRTVSYCRAAASASAAAFANQDVVRYARHALEALDLMERPSIRLRLHLLLAIALYSRSYTSTEFVSLLNEVIRLATEHGDAFSLVRAACLLYPHPGFKPLPGSLPVLERALSMLDDRHAGVRALAAAALACTAPHCYTADDNHALIGDALGPARARPVAAGALLPSDAAPPQADSSSATTTAPAAAARRTVTGRPGRGRPARS